MANSKGSQRGTHGTVLVGKDEARTANIDVPKHEPVDLDQPALVGLTEPFVDQRFALKPGKTTVGRRGDSDVVLPHDSVSSLHAWVIQDKGGYRVMNILSTNGTFVNDKKITEAVIHQGDRIRFGGVEMMLHTGMGASGSGSAGRWLAGSLLAVVVLGALGAGGWFFLNP